MEHKPLLGCNILVTRPEPDASRLARKLHSLGAKTFIFPTLNILTLDQKEFLNTLAIHDYGIFIFVSKHAVSAVFDSIEKLPQTATVFAIGPGTAQELAKHHVKAIIPSSKHYNSESLLALPSLCEVRHQNILIFSGEGGRTHLQDTLRQRGAKITVLPMYRRVAENQANKLLSGWQDKAINIIIATSADSLKALVNLFSPDQQTWLKQPQLLVISERMVQIARDLGFTKEQLMLANNASDQEIISALIEAKKKS